MYNSYIFNSKKDVTDVILSNILQIDTLQNGIIMGITMKSFMDMVLIHKKMSGIALKTNGILQKKKKR